MGRAGVKGNARVRCEGWWEPEAVDYKSNGRKQFCNSMNMASRWLDVTKLGSVRKLMSGDVRCENGVGPWMNICFGLA